MEDQTAWHRTFAYNMRGIDQYKLVFRYETVSKRASYIVKAIADSLLR